MIFTRYALYYAPPPDAPWTQFATRWLGWDMVAGQAVKPPPLAGLPHPIEAFSHTPRKYGLHATLKPPFRLADGITRADIENTCAALCAARRPVSLDGLRLTRLGRFLALCPAIQSPELTALATACVQDLDPLRAPPSPDDLAKRRIKNLSPRQDANLTRWGYPHVLDDFRFHITLTGRLPKPDLAPVQAALEQALTPLLPPTQMITNLALTGEDTDGKFHLLRRFDLSG